MTLRYQDIYPEPPVLDSARLSAHSAMSLLTLEFFEAQPGEMPEAVFEQHHILLNLQEQPHRVENWREGEHRDFIYHQNEIIVTPAGIRSGWKWHAPSKVIVITLEPARLERFAQSELGVLLTDKQLRDIPQFVDQDITQAGVMLMEAMKSDLGSVVMFESFARIFLTKLIHKYGIERDEELAFSKSFTSKHYKRVLDYIQTHFSQNITLERMAKEAGISPYHFARLFKRTIRLPPHQFLMAYRVEEAKKRLVQSNANMIDIAHMCGFADQAHFSRVFKKIEGVTPRQYQKNRQ